MILRMDKQADPAHDALILAAAMCPSVYFFVALEEHKGIWGTFEVL